MALLSPVFQRVARRFAWCSYLFLFLAWSGLATAQSAPLAWQLALGGLNNQPTGILVATASAADAQGNVFVTGNFSGSVMLGSTLLTTAVANTITDVFVAKWDATAQAFTWATSGGGLGSDEGHGIAVSGPNIYVTGSFQSGTSATFAGQPLAGTAGGTSEDIFVAKYLDTSAGHTPATSSFANGWATSGGGTGRDYGNAIAVSGTGVFVTGQLYSASNARIAGQSLAGAGVADIFVAKYLDTSTGNTPATSSFANGWATSAGGIYNDSGSGIAVRGTGVFVTGLFFSGSSASIAGQSLPGTGTFNAELFVAKYLDTSTGNTPATSSFANGWATSGGGTDQDYGTAIAVSGRGVFVTGVLESYNASIAGQPLTVAGTLNMFVAKYLDTSTGNTPATSSFANGWATSGGGTGNAIAVGGANVYVVGSFVSSSLSGVATSIAGQTLTGAGDIDMFLAKYLDTSTGNTTATSSFANAGAISGGGAYADGGYGLAVSGQQVYAVGAVLPPATFGSLALSAANVGQVAFISRLTDASLTPLPVRTNATASGLSLYPNPTRGAATLSGLAAGQVAQVYDTLGRLVGTAQAEAGSTVGLLPATLPAGVYVVCVGHQILRLAVE